MANPYLYQFPKTHEPEETKIDGYWGLDGSSNILPLRPTQSRSVSGVPYTRAKGMTNSIGSGASATTQPHLSTGVYSFTLNEPWVALAGASVECGWDGYASAPLLHTVQANVTGGGVDVAGSTVPTGNQPGNDPAINHQTVIVKFFNASHVLTDPPANSGFWLSLTLLKLDTP
jgi:hypothetical protein